MNDGIDSVLCSVKYVPFDIAVDMIAELEHCWQNVTLSQP